MNLEGLSDDAKLVMALVAGVLIGGLAFMAFLGVRAGGGRSRRRPRGEPPADLTPDGFVQEAGPEA